VCSSGVDKAWSVCELKVGSEGDPVVDVLPIVVCYTRDRTTASLRDQNMSVTVGRPPKSRPSTALYRSRLQHRDRTSAQPGGTQAIDHVEQMKPSATGGICLRSAGPSELNAYRNEPVVPELMARLMNSRPGDL
jgi:hypothetical protein